MGCVKGVSATEWPTQGTYLGMRCTVSFNYGNERFLGVIVRDDMTSPFETIIRLDDGRIVRAAECQCQPESLWPDPPLPVSILNDPDDPRPPIDMKQRAGFRWVAGPSEEEVTEAKKPSEP